MGALYLGALFGFVIGSVWDSMGIAVGCAVVGMMIGLFLHGVAWAHRLNREERLAERAERRRLRAAWRKADRERARRARAVPHLGQLGHSH